MTLRAILALCALFSYAMAQSLPECGNSGRQCIDGVSQCVGNECVCIDPPYVWGDGFFMCYRRNQVAYESRNDPSLTTFNNETHEFPFPCRYLVTHIRQELKGRGRQVIGSCDFKVHAFNARDRGKIYTHGIDIAVTVNYNNGQTVERSVRKYGTASSGVNTFVVNGVHDYVPDGPWTPSVDILYEDPTNRVEIKCEEEPLNNQMVFDFKACGIRATFVPYDIEDRRGQSQIPGLAFGVNCAHHPQWLSNDEVMALAPVFQGGQYVSQIVRPGLSESQSLVDRAFTNDAVQNQPSASPACSSTSTALAACNDGQRTSAYNSCYWMLRTPKFIKCAHKNGLDFVDLFYRCVASWCQGGDCGAVVTDISVCAHIRSQISELDDFLNNGLCP